MNYNMDIKKVYEFRQILKKLYSLDVCFSDDLIGNILSIKDNNDSVESISVEEQSYQKINLIKIVLAQGKCTKEEIDHITSQVNTILNTYIKKNIDHITVDDMGLFLYYIDHLPIFETVIVGRSITVFL